MTRAASNSAKGGFGSPLYGEAMDGNNARHIEAAGKARRRELQ
jgi:hypothetical protein